MAGHQTQKKSPQIYDYFLSKDSFNIWYLPKTEVVKFSLGDRVNIWTV